MSTEAEKLVARVRDVTDLPIAVGFGISTRAQVLEVWRYADAAGGLGRCSRNRKAGRCAGLGEAGRNFVHALLPQQVNSPTSLPNGAS